MNKSALTDYVAKHAKLSKAISEKAVGAIFQGISQSLKQGKDTRIIGFGSFTVANRAARKGRNPRTGDPIQIPAKMVPKFRPGKKLRQAVN